MTANLARVFAVDEPERSARLRELKMAAHLLLGPKHSVTRALSQAITVADPEAVAAAVAEIDGLAALPKRRLLAVLAAVLPA